MQELVSGPGEPKLLNTIREASDKEKAETQKALRHNF